MPATTRNRLLISCLVVGTFIVQIFLHRRPSTELQFASLVGLLGLVVALLLSVRRVAAQWHRRRLQALVGTGVTLVAIGGYFAAPFLGEAWALADFKRALPLYTAIVHRADTSTARRTILSQPEMPPALSKSVHRVLWWRDSTGALGVEFWYGGGFPARHFAYLHYAGAVTQLTSPPAARWRSRRQIAPNWYSVRN